MTASTTPMPSCATSPVASALCPSSCARAELLRLQGRPDDARSLVEPALRDVPGQPHLTLAFAAACLAQRRFLDPIHPIHAALRQPDLDPHIRMLLLFQLGQCLDGAGRFDDAFNAFRQANALKGASFDPAAHAAAVDRVIRHWSRHDIARAPRSPVSTGLPVFVVGMPRSGTSLVEQILAAHPAVHGCGELPFLERDIRALARSTGLASPYAESPRLFTPHALARIARDYLRHLTRRARTARRATDKLPLNVMHLGPIALLFPNARVIHCLRDPLDTCFSCYAHDFGGHLPFTYNLAHLGAFYRDYARLARHWRHVLDLPIFELRYEQLVAEPERCTRDLLRFLDLPSDDACLQFHHSGRTVRTASMNQARQGIYRHSVGRARRYRHHLAPLIDALGLVQPDRS